MKIWATIILMSVCSMSVADTSSDVKKAIMANFKHTQAEDVAAVMGDMHSQSPAYLPTKQMLQQLFPAYDLAYELVDYRFVGEDGEYAYAKIRQRTTKISGPAFQNNELEVLMVFKQENGVWKLWTQANLAVTYL